jgi:hypothetical protein
MEKETVDPHLLYIAKNTTPLQRMMWWKKNLVFWKKIQANIQTKHQSKNGPKS